MVRKWTISLCLGVGIAFVLLMSDQLRAQESLEKFRQRIEPYYHYLSQADVSNFSCLISSSLYIDFIKQKADSQYFYPLKFVWMKEGKAYYILQPLPQFKDSHERQQILTHVQELKQVFQGVLLDWEKYNLDSPLGEFSSTATLRRQDNSIIVDDTILANQQKIFIRRIYSPAGLLLEDDWESGDLRIVNYPVFQTVENRWVCTGWQSQIYRHGKVSSGMAVGMELARFEGQWMPVRFNIVAQSQKNPNQKAVTTLFLKNYRFNENLEVLHKYQPQSPQGKK